MTSNALIYTEARRLFRYNKRTGLVSRRVRCGRMAAGDRCGSQKGNGHLQVEVNGKNYLVHRLVWLLVTGAWPNEHIDHRNGNKADNRWLNLRCLSQAINVQNQRRARSDNQCGLLGVATVRGRYRASIGIDGKQEPLGTFTCPEEAHTAYLVAKRQLHIGNTL